MDSIDLCGREVAERAQLALEYDPQPLFASGSPRTAPRILLTTCVRLRSRYTPSGRSCCQQRAANGDVVSARERKYHGAMHIARYGAEERCVDASKVNGSRWTTRFSGATSDNAAVTIERRG